MTLKKLRNRTRIFIQCYFTVRIRFLILKSMHKINTYVYSTDIHDKHELL